MARFSNGSSSEMSNRITICFSSGDVMFEGKSALAQNEHEEEEECPPTMRSAAVSGVFKAMRRGAKKDSERVA